MKENEFIPYVGPRPFEREKEDSDRFFGRSHETQEIVSMIFGHPITLVYAQSGAGKTSLFNASITPKLEENRFDVLPLTRVGGIIPKEVELQEIKNLYIFNALLKLDSESDPREQLTKTLSGFLNKRDRATDESGQPCPQAIIFDQFEEIFTYTPENWREQRDGFFRQVVEAVEADPLLRVVFVIREDFLAELDPYTRNLPERLRIRYRLERLGENAALRAIKDPLKRTARKFAPDVAEGLVDQLLAMRTVDATGKMAEIEGQYVEPVQLQVVCVTLWSTLGSDVTEIQQTHLKNFNVNEALSDFYRSAIESAVKETGVQESDLRNWFGKTLITPMGTRSTVFRGEESTGDIDNRAVDFLESRHIIRAEYRAGARWYELTHDRLVAPIIDSNQKWIEKLSPLQRQAALWNDQNRGETWLSRDDQALIEMEVWAEIHEEELTDVERDFLNACRQLQMEIKEKETRELRERENERKFAEAQARSAKIARRFSVVTGFLVILALIATGFAINSANEARVNETAAKNAKANAEKLAEDARAGELAVNAMEGNSLDLSMLLSVEAYNAKPGNPDAENVLFNNGQLSSRLQGFLANPTNPASQFRFSPDGKYIAYVKEDDAKKRNLILWDVEKGREISPALDSSGIDQFFFIFNKNHKFLVYLNHEGINFSDLENNGETDLINTHKGEISRIIFNSDGTTHAALGENGDVLWWQADTPSHPVRGDVVAFSPDGSEFARFELDTITLEHIGTGDKKENSTQEPKILKKDPYSITSMAFNQDGSLLVFADRDNNIGFWDLSIDKELETGIPLDKEVRKMAVLPNGNLVVSIPPENLDPNTPVTGEVRILDGKKGNQVNRDTLEGVDFKISPDGKILAILNSGSKITFYKLEQDTKITEPIPGILTEFSWDSKMAAVYDQVNNKLTLWDVSSCSNTTCSQSGELPFQNQGNEASASVASMSFNPDGNLFAAGFDNGSIIVWDVNDQSNKYPPARLGSSNPSPVTSLAFSPDGSQLIAGTGNSELSEWDLSQQQPKTPRDIGFPGHIDKIDLGPDGDYLYSIARDGVALVDVTEKPDSIGEVFAGDTVRFVDDNKVMVVSSEKDNIILWDLPSAHKIDEIKGAVNNKFGSQGFSPQGRIMAISEDGNNRLLSTRTGNILLEIPNIYNPYYYSPKEQFLVTLDQSGLIDHFINTDTGEEKENFIGSRYLNSSQFGPFSPNEEVFIRSLEAGQYELRYTATGDVVSVGEPILVNVNQPYYQFSPRGDILVTSSVDEPGMLDIWNFAADQPLIGSITGNRVDFFNEPGTRLISYSTNNLSTLWNLANLKKIATMPGSFNQISPDGKIVVMNNYNSVSLWNIDSGGFVGELPTGGYNYNSNIKFSGDGRTMLAYSCDNNNCFTPKLWDMVKGEPLGESITGNYLETNSDISVLATRSSAGGSISIWDAVSGRQLGGPVQAISGSIIGNAKFDSNGTILVSRVEDKVSVNNRMDLLSDGSAANFSQSSNLFSLPLVGIQPPSDNQGSTDTLIISPDDKSFVLFSPNGSLTLWDISTPTLPFSINNVKDFQDPVQNPLLSPIGDLLAAPTEDGISLWETASGTQVRTLPNSHIREVSDLYVNPDSKTRRLVVKYNDGGISLLDIDSGEPVGDPIHDEAFCAFSPDGGLFVTTSTPNTYSYTSYCYLGSNSSIYTLRNSLTGDQIGDRLIGGSNSGETIIFSPDGKYVVFHALGESEFKVMRVMKKEQNKEIELELIGEPILGSFQNFLSDGRHVISYTAGEYRLWDASSEDRDDGIKVPGYFWSVSSDGTRALFYNSNYKSDTSSYVYTFYLWDLEKNPPQQIGEGKDNLIDYSINPDGSLMSISTEKGIYNLWDLSSGDALKIEGRPISFSPNGQYIAVVDDSGDSPPVTTIYSRDNKLVSGPYMGDLWGFAGPNNEVVVFKDKNGFILYDAQGGDPINEGKPISGDSLIFSSDGENLIAYSYGGDVSLWHSSTADVFSVIGNFVGFDPESDILVTNTTTSDGKKEFFLWDVTNGFQRGDPYTYDGTLSENGIRISSDQGLLSGFGNEGVFVWDLMNPDDKPKELNDPTGMANQIKFSPDGNYLASVGNDGIILWDVSTGENLTGLKNGNTGHMLDLAFNFSQDSRKLIFVDSDGTPFELNLDTPKQEPGPRSLRISNPCGLVLNQDGTILAYWSGKKLWIRNLNSPTSQEIAEKISCSGGIAFSEDNKRLAYSDGNRIIIKPLEDSSLNEIELTGDSDIYELTFVWENPNDPDYKILAATGTDGRIYFWDTKAHSLIGIFDQPGKATRYADGKIQIYLKDERRLIRIGFDNWQGYLNSWITDLCTKAGRELSLKEWHKYFPDFKDPATFSCPMPRTDRRSESQ